MTFKEYLLSKGLSEEQATAIVSGMPENKLYLASEENLDERYTKLKSQKEQSDTDLDAANKLVTDLKRSNQDVEGLQTKITEYETKVQTLETERVAERKTYAIKEALAKEGVTDVEYMSYKLGDLEIDKDGKVKDLESKVKSLKEANPTFFGVDTTQSTDPKAPGYKVVDNKLDNSGKKTDFDLKNMSVDDINNNWDAIVQSNQTK